MRLLYHFLGAIAKANSTLWRYRVNFIPLNLIGILGLTTVGVRFWDNGVEALRNSESPGDARLAMIWAVLTFFALGCIGVVTFMRNIVFRGSGRVMVQPPPTADISQPVKVRASGRFVLDAESARRFINMPALLTIVQGRPVLLSNIRVSNRFMGVRTKERSGTWSLAMEPSTLCDGESGFLFFGLSCYPSFRLSYLDESGDRERAIISVDDPKRLGLVVSILAKAGLHLKFSDVG